MIDYNNRAWYKHIFIWRGTVLKGVFIRVILYMLWTAFVILLFQEGVISKDTKIDMSVFSIIGLALGLLLVFRTNTSYDRWWEGRKFLTGNVNATRNIAFTLDTIIPRDDKSSRQEIVELLTAFHVAVKEKLRDGVKAEDLSMLREEYKNDVLNSGHEPNEIIKIFRSKLEVISSVTNCKDSRIIKIIDQTNNLIDNMGGMERIRFTPMPFAYASHLQLFILVYFLSLPFGLYDKFGWLALPVMAFITLILIGINEIGVEIEDPFGDDPNDLPVDGICETVEKNLTGILLK